MVAATQDREPVTDTVTGSRFALRVVVYALSVILVGAPLLGWMLVHDLPRIDWWSSELIGQYVLMIMLFGGELRLLRVVRSDGDAERLTISSTFAVALAVTGPLSLAVVAQLLATGLDDVRHRRPPLVVGFNLAQYVITLTAVRAAFVLPQGQPMLSLHPGLGSAAAVGWALVTTVVYFAVNTVVVDVVVALTTRQSLITILGEDLKVQGLSSAILLGLAPVTAVVADDAPLLLPLIVLPIVGVQRNSWIAAQRQHEALHDGLTGLPNRALFRLRAERAVREAEDADGRAAVMLVDLDHFKEVNDTLGHHAGDGLLREVAARMSESMPDPVTIARLGGDEFAIIVPHARARRGVEDLAAQAERMLARLREPLFVDGVRIGVHASVGVAVYPDHATAVEGLLRRADIALYRAKVNRGEVVVYDSEMDEHSVERLSLAADLASAQEEGQFSLVFQPQADRDPGGVVAVEALTRWRHPQLGDIPPETFIPLAENNETITVMTRSAIERSLVLVQELSREGREIAVAVNLSARLLSDLGFPVWLATCLEEASLPGDRLTVEVTETSIMADPARAMKVLDDVRALGVRIAIDDFGTGYSSLSYLRRLRPDVIKIDKSFVGQMLVDENSAVIVRSTVDLAHGLGLQVVAEGIEDADTYAALLALGCDRMQGYYVSPPLRADALRSWLADHAAPGGGRLVPAQGATRS